MAKKKAPAKEKDMGERWLLTYADLITLLMAFFMIMYGLSQMDKAKFNQMANSLASVFPASRSAFIPVPLPKAGGQKGKEPTTVMRKQPDKPPSALAPQTGVEKTDIERLGEQFRELAKQEGLESTVTVSASPNGKRLTVRLSESLLFAAGNSMLTPEAQSLIDKIADIIRKANKPVRVEGHTDNVPIHTAQFQSNWELSTARASSVIRYMVDQLGFSPEILSASGYGEYRPIAPNDTSENRAKNRRVEFVITETDEDA